MKIIEVTNVDFSLRHFLLPLMRGARQRGHDVIGVCADGPLLDGIRAEGFRVETVPFQRRLSPLGNLRALAALVRLLKAEKPDIVHAHMPISGFLARLAAAIAGVPCVAYTCHGFLFNQGGGALRCGAGYAMERLGARWTDIWSCVSSADAADARRLRIWRDPVVVGNGRDPAAFRPDPAARGRVRAELGVPAGAVAVVAVSRLVMDKGYTELAAAMRDVPDAELWVVGERLATDRGEDVAELLKQAGLGTRLRLLGYRHDVAAVLAAADIFVLPSYHEALPMSVIEAMLAGLPVVASNLPGTRQQVEDGETGILVPPRAAPPLAGALMRLAGDAALRAAMGQAGRVRAMRLFDETRVVGGVLDLLGL
ncbi:MAG: glycosyltransferase family 4 protein [Proteobacteria bacterium]|nr:glycosyltransferase family 4 protein [Pseudomonadota bacterium]